MIIPGLDVLDGTSVNGDLINSDELRKQHTEEIMSLLDAENERRRKNNEDFISMMEFCFPYSIGEKKTNAMIQAELKKQNNTNVRELIKWSPDLWALALKSAKGRALPKPDNPGLVMAIGAGFSFDSVNHVFAKQLHEVFAQLKNYDELYLSPEYTLHVTIATAWKGNNQTRLPEPVLSKYVEFIRTSSELKEEMKKGKIELIAKELKLINGNAIIVIFEDLETRYQAIRNILQRFVEKHFANEPLVKQELRVPTLVHSSIVRVTNFPRGDAVKFQNDLENAVKNWQPCKVVIDDLILLLEKDSLYFHDFPKNVVARVIPNDEDKEDKKIQKEEEEEEERGGKSDKDTSSEPGLFSRLMKLALFGTFIGAIVIAIAKSKNVSSTIAAGNVTTKRL